MADNKISRRDFINSLSILAMATPLATQAVMRALLDTEPDASSTMISFSSNLINLKTFNGEGYDVIYTETHNKYYYQDGHTDNDNILCYIIQDLYNYVSVLMPLIAIRIKMYEKLVLDSISAIADKSEYEFISNINIQGNSVIELVYIAFNKIRENATNKDKRKILRLLDLIEKAIKG